MPAHTEMSHCCLAPSTDPSHYLRRKTVPHSKTLLLLVGLEVGQKEAGIVDQDWSWRLPVVAHIAEVLDIRCYKLDLLVRVGPAW